MPLWRRWRFLYILYIRCGPAGLPIPGLSRRLTREEIEAKLADDIEKTKAVGEEGVETDQYHVFKFVIKQLEH